MKKYFKFLITMTLSLGLFICTASISYGATDYFKMTKSGTSSYTVNWHYTQSDFQKENYQIIGWYITGNDGAIIKKSSNPSITSFKVTNLKCGHENRLSLYYNYKYNNTVYKYFVDSCYVNTKPKTIQKSKMAVTGVSTTAGTVDFRVGTDYGLNYQLQIYNKKTGKRIKNISQSSPYFFNVSIACNKVYKYRARTYIVNPTDNKRYYGNWSKYKYFVSPKIYMENRSSKNGCKLKIKGVSGVSKYKIYVSTSNTAKGKYTKTVTPKVGKFKSYTINKIGKSSMKKNKSYYVTIVPIIKTTGKQSEVVGRGNFYNFY